MSREVPTRINIILDGNSIPNGYSTVLVTALDNEYGVGTYDYTMIAVGGQDIDDMISRINLYVNNNIKGFASKNLLVFQELRNQMVAGSTPAEAVTKLKTYVQTIRALLPSFVTLKTCVVTAIADDDEGANIPAANAIVMADTSGDFDFKIDLYNYSTFNDYTSSLFDPDQTHMSALGKTTAANYIAAQLKAQYPS